MPHSVALYNGEHAGNRRLDLIEEREQVLYSLLRIGWLEAKIDHAFGHRRTGSIEEPSVIPVERQQHAVFACRSRQDLLIRYPGGVEHDGGYVVPGGREDLNASQREILVGEEAHGGYRASAA